MAADLISVKARDDYTLWLRFQDGMEGSVFLGNLVEIASFSAWRNVREFLQARVDMDGAAVSWPAGVRLAGEVFYMDIAARGGKANAASARAFVARRSLNDPPFQRFMARALAPLPASRRRRRPRPE
jgi:hypothetical protein